MPSFTSATPWSTFSRVTQFLLPPCSSGPNSPQLEPGGLCFQRGVISVVVAAEPFGDQRRLFGAFAFHGGGPGDLHAIPLDALELLQREARAHARAHRHRRGEAHAVQAVVDTHLAVAKAEGRFRQMRQQRQRQKAMGDRAAKCGSFGARRVDVDPLEVVDRPGEIVDALLRDLDPRRDADFLPDAGLEAADGAHLLNCAPNPWRSRSRMLVDSLRRRAAPAGSMRSSSARTASYASMCWRRPSLPRLNSCDDTPESRVRSSDQRAWSASRGAGGAGFGLARVAAAVAACAATPRYGISSALARPSLGGRFENLTEPLSGSTQR